MKKRKRTVKDLEQEVFMNIKTDFGFKKIFAKKRLLIAFLNTMSILPEPVKDIEYLSPEQFGLTEEYRKAVYDVFCKTVSGKHFIIEMQIAEQSHFIERLLYYIAMVLINQAPKGKIKKINKKGEEVEVDWNYEIDGVYVVAILDFILFKEEAAKDTIVERVKLKRENTNLTFTDKIEIVTIELPKFTKVLETLSDSVEEWIYTFKYLHKMYECPKEIKDNALKELYIEAQINKLTKKEMNRYKRSVLEYDDVRDAVSFAEEKGIKIGRQEGKKEERVQLIRDCYSRGISVKQIAEFMRFTEEEILSMLED
jgi:predicted transposase/invertase (TIGR01784 family)